MGESTSHMNGEHYSQLACSADAGKACVWQCLQSGTVMCFLPYHVSQHCDRQHCCVRVTAIVRSTVEISVLKNYK